MESAKATLAIRKADASRMIHVLVVIKIAYYGTVDSQGLWIRNYWIGSAKAIGVGNTMYKSIYLICI